MSKSLLLSIKPKYVAKILNGEKTIEVRKRFPKDYRGWVYIYCTKDKRNSLYVSHKWVTLPEIPTLPSIRNGKVVARFYCDNVEEWDIWQDDLEEKLKLACLSVLDFDKYSKGQVAYAIHISQLEIFDRPKELSDFRKIGKHCVHDTDLAKRETWCEWCHRAICIGNELTKAPQSWQYIEEVE